MKLLCNVMRNRFERDYALHKLIRFGYLNRMGNEIWWLMCHSSTFQNSVA